MPAVTGRDEPWPFFLFWRHHFWPNLALSILNFCRSKRSFQWYPGRSDRPIGAWDMHKNAQNVEWKTQSKVSCHYTWLLHVKNCPSRWRFLRSFLTAKKLSIRSITAAKIKENEKRRQNIFKKNLISAHARARMLQKERKASCHVANAFLTRLKLIWPISSLKTSKCPQNAFLAKSARRQWVKEYFSCLFRQFGKTKFLPMIRDLFFFSVREPCKGPPFSLFP